MNEKQLRKEFDVSIEGSMEMWKNMKEENRQCLHQQCSSCRGTGIKKDKSVCVHMISCPCPKCSLTC